MDPETKNFITSRDMVFYKVSSSYQQEIVHNGEQIS